MIVVGFDPSVRHVGYSVIRCSMASHVELLEFGAWNLLQQSSADSSVGTRLEILHARATTLLEKWNPRWVGIEKAVSFKNPQSAFKLCEARGVLRLACYQVLDNMDERLLELSPTAIKKNTTGWGRGSKDDMFRALELRFHNLGNFVEAQKLSQNPLKTSAALPHDAYDALGIAWTTWVLLRQKLRLGLTIQMNG